jgi:hypothetical protein
MLSQWTEALLHSVGRVKYPNVAFSRAIKARKRDEHPVPAVAVVL